MSFVGSLASNSCGGVSGVGGVSGGVSGGVFGGVSGGVSGGVFGGVSGGVSGVGGVFGAGGVWVCSNGIVGVVHPLGTFTCFFIINCLHWSRIKIC